MIAQFVSPLQIFQSALLFFSLGCVVSAILGLFCLLAIAQMIKALALGLLSLSVPLFVLDQLNWPQRLAFVHLFSNLGILLPTIAFFVGEAGNPSLWTLIIWLTQIFFALVLLANSAFAQNPSVRRPFLPALFRMDHAWATSCAVSVQLLTQTVCSPQVTVFLCETFSTLGLRNPWAYQSVQVFLVFASSLVAVFTVRIVAHKDVLIFCMAAATVAYFALGITFSFLSTVQNSMGVSFSIAVHALLSCLFPIILLTSWIYSTSLLSPDIMVGGMSITMASRWLVDASMAFAFPFFLRNPKSVSFFVLGTVCFLSTIVFSRFPNVEKDGEIMEEYDQNQFMAKEFQLGLKSRFFGPNTEGGNFGETKR